VLCRLPEVRRREAMNLCLPVIEAKCVPKRRIRGLEGQKRDSRVILQSSRIHDLAEFNAAVQNDSLTTLFPQKVQVAYLFHPFQENFCFFLCIF
jgi:hypothetical protein